MGECVVWKMQKSNTKYKYITNKRDSETDRQRDRQRNRRRDGQAGKWWEPKQAWQSHCDCHPFYYSSLLDLTVPRTLGRTIQVKWLIAGHSGSGVVGRGIGTVVQWTEIAVWQFIINESILFILYLAFFFFYVFFRDVSMFYVSISNVFSKSFISILCFNASELKFFNVFLFYVFYCDVSMFYVLFPVSFGVLIYSMF